MLGRVWTWHKCRTIKQLCELIMWQLSSESRELQKQTFARTRSWDCNQPTILDKSPWDSTSIFIFFCHFSVPSYSTSFSKISCSFFGLLMKDRKWTNLFPSFQSFLNVFQEFARNEWYTPKIAVSHSGSTLFQRIKAQLFCLISTIYLLIKRKRRASLLIKQEILCFLFNKQSFQDKLV